jgi:type III restriction enzyme
MTQVVNTFSLSDITDLSAFRALGERYSTEPAGTLRRVRLSARIVQGQDGLRRTVMTTAPAEDRVESQAMLDPLDKLREDLLDRLMLAQVVPARKNQRYPAGLIVDAFIAGLGPHAAPILSAYMDRAAGGLIEVVTDVQRKIASEPKFDEVVDLVPFAAVRTGRAETTTDRFSTFRKGVGYQGYKKSLYSQDWFDSSTERTVANVLDDADEIHFWVRLLQGDLPILWSGAREYNPDFIAVDRNSANWVIEVKMDREMTTDEVRGKRKAALRWANYVSADEIVGATWRYLLVSESDVATARGSWSALVRLGG